jgi:rhamnosyltransferase
MLLAGWSVSYCATARVRHSHDYSVFQDMQRYFDFGVLHAQLPQLLQELGEPEGDGLRFVKSELRYMTAAAPWRLPEVVVRMFKKLPNFLRRRLSMTAGYWDSSLTDGRV